MADGSEVTVQPLRKCFPRIAARDVDGRTAVGIAQAHEREIEVQRPDQHVGKPSGDGRRFSPNPRRRDRRKRHEIPERCSQPVDVAGIHCSARQAGARANRPSLPDLEEELVRRNEERVLLQDPADDHHRVRPHNIHGHARAEF